MGTGKGRKSHPSDLQLEIGGIVRIEPEHPAGPHGHPFERNGGESEDEGLHSRGLFKSEAFALKDAEEMPVVVVQKAIDALDISCGNLEGVIDSFGGECLRITHYPLWHIPLDMAVFLGEVESCAK